MLDKKSMDPPHPKYISWNSEYTVYVYSLC